MAYPYRYAPDAEVSGAVMISLFNHYRRDDVIDSLQRHGLDNLDAERWYSVDPFIRLLDEWSKMPSFSTNLISVGMAMIYHLEPPEDTSGLSPVEKLLMLGEMHMAHHRNGDAGSYTIRQLNDKTIRYIENTIWPDDMIYGYIYGAAQRYLGQGNRFTLRYMAGTQRQDMGGTETTLDLSWD